MKICHFLGYSFLYPIWNQFKIGHFGPRPCAIAHCLYEKQSFFGFSLSATKMEEIRKNKKKYFQTRTVCYSTLFMWKMIIFWVFPPDIQKSRNSKQSTSRPWPCAIEHSLCEKWSYFGFSLPMTNMEEIRKRTFLDPNRVLAHYLCENLLFFWVFPSSIQNETN